MAETAALIARIGADLSDLKKEVNSIGPIMQSAGQKLQSWGKELSTKLTAPIALIGGFALKGAADLEEVSTSFRVLVGDAEKANEVLQMLSDFGASTPFEFPEIANAAKKLLAFGTAAEDLEPTLTMLGDIASGLGIPFSELADIYGKIQVQGRVFAEDINQLTGRGIPVIQELAKIFGVAESEVRGLVETGKVGFPEIQHAMMNLAAEGGKFGGMMEAQGKTLWGLFSTLKDAVVIAFTSVGDSLRTQFNLNEVLANVIGLIDSLAMKVVEFTKQNPELTKLIAVFLGIAAAIGPVIAVAGTLLTALSPVLLVVTAISAAVALAVTYWGDIVEVWDRITGAAESSGGAMSGVLRIWEALRDGAVTIFGAIWDTVKVYFDRVVENVSESLDKLQEFWDKWGDDIIQAIERSWSVISTFISSAITIIANTIRGFLAVLRGDWGVAWDSLKNIAGAVWDYLKSFILNSVDAILHGMQTLFDWIPGASNKIQGLRDKLGKLIDSSAVRVAAEEVKRVVDGTATAQEDASNRVTKTILTNSKTVVSATEDEEEAQKKLKKAFDDLEDSLVEIDVKQAALGNTFNGAKEKAKAYQDVLVTLAQEGKRNTEEFANFEQKLRDANDAAAQFDKDRAIDKVLSDLDSKLKEINTSSVTFGGKFDENREKVRALKDAIKRLSEEGLGPTDSHILALSLQIQQLNAESGKTPAKLREMSTSLEDIQYDLKKAEEASVSFSDRLMEWLSTTALRPVLDAFTHMRNLIGGKGNKYESIAGAFNAATEAARAFKATSGDIPQMFNDMVEGALNAFGPKGQAASAVLGFLDELGLGLDDIGKKMASLLGIGRGGSNSNPDLAKARNMIASLRSRGVSDEEIISTLTKQFPNLSESDIRGLVSGNNTAWIQFRDWVGQWDDNEREKRDVVASVTNWWKNGYSADAIRGIATNSAELADEVRHHGADRVARWVDEILGKLMSYGIGPDDVGALAKGGIVTRPSLSWIAEAGVPEAVIPLPKLPGLIAAMMPVGGGGNINLTVTLDGRVLTTAVMRNLPGEYRLRLGGR